MKGLSHNEVDHLLPAALVRRSRVCIEQRHRHLCRSRRTGVYDRSDLAVFYYPILVALADWEFEPVLVDDRPVSLTYILTFRFGVK